MITTSDLSMITSRKKARYTSAKRTKIWFGFKEYTLDSKLELDYFKLLELRRLKGIVRNIEIHKRHVLIPKNADFPRDSCMESDFDFDELIDGKWVHCVVDCKGHYTQLSQFKHRLFRDRYGFLVRIIKKA